MPQKPLVIDWLILSSLVAMWGTSFAMIKIAVASIDPLWIMALRLTIAALVLVPYAMLRGQPLRAGGAVWAKFTWLGLIGNVVPFFLISWGTAFISSGVSGLLMAAIPLFIVVLAHFVLPDDRLTLPKAVGFVIGFVGIVVLIGPRQLVDFSLAGQALLGELAVLAGGLCYAVHGVTAKRLGFENPLKQSAGVCLAGAAMGVVLAVLLSPAGLAGLDWRAALAVAGLGLLPTALATVVVYWLMQRIGPVFVSYSNYLVPIFAVLLGAAALGEQLSWNVLAALLLVLAGIAVSRSTFAPRWRRTP